MIPVFQELLPRSLKAMATDDPDHRHFYRLLGMLPLPTPENSTFWDRVAEVNGTSREYIDEKMSSMALYVDTPVPPSNRPGTNIGYTCEYVIMFFGGEKPRLWDAIAGAVFSIGDDAWTHIGRMFTQDLVDTAWRLLVRYGRFPNENRMVMEWHRARRGWRPRPTAE